MASQYVGGLIEPHKSDLAVIPHPVISLAACSADLGFQIESQVQHQALPTMPMKVGGRTMAFPLILLHSLAWINLAQYCLEQSKGLKVFQGLISDYFGATAVSNSFAGDGLFMMLDADLDVRILYWTLHAAFFNPAIDPPLTATAHISERAMESAGLSSIILWSKERQPGIILHVVLRLALDQWLGDQSVTVTVDSSKHIKVVLPQPGAQTAYKLALDHVGNDVLIAWCFLHAQSSDSSITAIGDDYSMEVWISDHKQAETTSVGATLRGEQESDSRDQVYSLISEMLELPAVKRHPEIVNYVSESEGSPLDVIDHVSDKADEIIHATTVLLGKPAVPAATDLKKGSPATLDFEIDSHWVLDNESSIPCPPAPEVRFPNAAELGHGSAACVFVKPVEVPGKQSSWLEDLGSGAISTDTVDVSRGPAYGVNIKIPEKANVSGKYTVAQLVGNLDRKAARAASIFDVIRNRIADAIAQLAPGATDSRSLIITDTTIDPDTSATIDTGWYIMQDDVPVNVSDIIRTDANSQLSIDLLVPSGSVCKVIRTTNTSEHTVSYSVEPFDPAVYTGSEPVPEKPYDALTYVKLTWITRSSPAQTVAGIFDLDGWIVYACEQLDAFYKRASTAITDSQKDVSSGNKDPETVGKSDDDQSWMWLLLLLLLMSSMNNQTNITLHVDSPKSASDSTPDEETDSSADIESTGNDDEAFSLSAHASAEGGRAGDAANPNQVSSVKPELRR